MLVSENKSLVQRDMFGHILNEVLGMYQVHILVFCLLLVWCSIQMCFNSFRSQYIFVFDIKYWHPYTINPANSKVQLASWTHTTQSLHENFPCIPSAVDFQAEKFDDLFSTISIEVILTPAFDSKIRFLSV